MRSVTAKTPGTGGVDKTFNFLQASSLEAIVREVHSEFDQLQWCSDCLRQGLHVQVDRRFVLYVFLLI